MSPSNNVSPRQKHRILLVDDHAIVREGFSELINGHPDLQVCGEAEAAPAALQAVERLQPDVVVTDLSLQGGSGLDLIKNLKALYPALPILVLSMHDETIYAERALRAGALGYVMKRQDSATLLRAIREVIKGRVFLSPSMRERMLRKVVGGQPESAGSGVEQLSDREMEVFRLIGEGLTTRQIARKLQVSVSTVETHRAHLKDKLGLDSGTALVRAAIEWVGSR